MTAEDEPKSRTSYFPTSHLAAVPLVLTPTSLNLGESPRIHPMDWDVAIMMPSQDPDMPRVLKRVWQTRMHRLLVGRFRQDP